MYGTLTKLNAGAIWTDFLGIEVGDASGFKVMDNGEGNKSDPDLFSDIYLDVPEEFICLDVPVPLYEISNGNIQVKP
jgi:hypothetical protein